MLRNEGLAALITAITVLSVAMLYNTLFFFFFFCQRSLVIATVLPTREVLLLRKKENDNKKVRGFAVQSRDRVYAYLVLQDKSVSLIFAAVFGRLKAQDQPQAHLSGFQSYEERARAQRGAH